MKNAYPWRQDVEFMIREIGMANLRIIEVKYNEDHEVVTSWQPYPAHGWETAIVFKIVGYKRYPDDGRIEKRVHYACALANPLKKEGRRIEDVYGIRVSTEKVSAFACDFFKQFYTELYGLINVEVEDLPSDG